VGKGERGIGKMGVGKSASGGEYGEGNNIVKRGEVEGGGMRVKAGGGKKRRWQQGMGGGREKGV